MAVVFLFCFRFAKGEGSELFVGGDDYVIVYTQVATFLAAIAAEIFEEAASWACSP